MPTNRKRDEARLFQEVLDVGPLESLQAELIREISFLALTPFVGKRRRVETLLEAHRAYKEALERHCQWLSQAFTELCAIVDRGRTVAQFYVKYGPVPHTKLDEALKALCAAYGREIRDEDPTKCEPTPNVARRTRNNRNLTSTSSARTAGNQSVT